MTNLHYCARCLRETEWAPSRRGARRERCKGCRTAYPCVHACAHLDCELARREFRSGVVAS